MRYFLIDKVTELEVGRRVRGIKNITFSDEVLHDHFPDHPIMPVNVQKLLKIPQTPGSVAEVR